MVVVNGDLEEALLKLPSAKAVLVIDADTELPVVRFLLIFKVRIINRVRSLFKIISHFWTVWKVSLVDCAAIPNCPTEAIHSVDNCFI